MRLCQLGPETIGASTAHWVQYHYKTTYRHQAQRCRHLLVSMRNTDDDHLRESQINMPAVSPLLRLVLYSVLVLEIKVEN